MTRPQQKFSDPRSPAAAQRLAGEGTRVDASGRLAMHVGPEFYFDNGVLRFRGDGKTFVVGPGSPTAGRVLIADDSIEVTPKGVRARPNSDQVKPRGFVDRTLTALLNRFEKAFKAGDAAIAASILPFKCGTDTLGGGSCQFIPGFDLSIGTYAVFTGRRSIGSSPGHLFSDTTTWTASKVQVDSTDPADDADFWWMVVKLT